MIATYDRWELLKTSLRSLGKQTHKDFSVHIVIDGNIFVPPWLKKTGIELIINKKRLDVVAAYGRYTERCKEGLLFNACDDIIYHPSCLSHAVYAIQKHYPKGPGVIGINQLQDGSPKGRKYAFTLMNRAYINLFPGGIIFCPDYIHYNSDRENGIFAQTIRKFTFCPEAKIDHIRLRDHTTELGLRVYRRDRDTWNIRQKKGLLWGKSFALIGGK
jgi:hypothetical protein